MPDRSSETLVTFSRPFRLASFDAPQPAGTYRLVTDEEEILGVSFPAYRRTATVLHTPAVSVVSGHRQAFPVDPEELESALKADAANASGVPARNLGSL
jgi:hypothetical protein